MRVRKKDHNFNILATLYWPPEFNFKSLSSSKILNDLAPLYLKKAASKYPIILMELPKPQ